jgi:hypothetical protein
VEVTDGATKHAVSASVPLMPVMVWPGVGNSEPKVSDWKSLGWPSLQVGSKTTR